MRTLRLLFLLSIFISIGLASHAQLETRLRQNDLIFRDNNMTRVGLSYNGLSFIMRNFNSSGSIFIDAPNTLQLQTGNLDETRLYINQNGQVGINTNNPLNRFDIRGDLALSGGNGDINFYESSALKARLSWSGSDLSLINQETDAGSNDISLRADNGNISMQTGGANRLRILESGFVGINTTDPQSRLDVNGDIALSNGSGRLIFREGDLFKALVNYDGNDLTIRNQEASTTSNDISIETLNGAINFETDDASRMLITESGNVGIRTTSPDQELDVNGDIALTDGTGRIEFKEGSGVEAFINWNGNDLSIRNQETATGSNDIGIRADGGNVTFRTGSAGNRRMVLEEDGGMRLYESNGNSYLLDVGNGNMQFIGDGGDVAMSIDDANGNIRIGSGSPNSSRKLEVRGDGSNETGIWVDNSDANGTTNIRIAVRGMVDRTFNTNVGVWGEATGGTNDYGGYFVGDLLYTGTFINGSDRKFKQNIQDFDALEKVLELRPRTYEMKQKTFPQMSFSKGLEYGFIAQELQNTFPTLVSKNPMPAKEDKHKVLSDEHFLGVNYIKMIPILTRAIQEQHSIIEEKEEQIEQLHDRVAKLEQLFEQLVNQQSIELEKPSNQFYLKQNQPNPFSTTTTIEYSIPEKANESKIIFTDLNGSVIKTVVVNGTGQLEITTPDLPAGTYTYSLVIDGKVVSTNKMILTK